jgi:hypothetical protein
MSAFRRDCANGPDLFIYWRQIPKIMVLIQALTYMLKGALGEPAAPELEPELEPEPEPEPNILPYDDLDDEVFFALAGERIYSEAQILRLTPSAIASLGPGGCGLSPEDRAHLEYAIVSRAGRISGEGRFSQASHAHARARRDRLEASENSSDLDWGSLRSSW